MSAQSSPVHQSTLSQRRRERTFFTDKQLQELQRYFKKNLYPSAWEQEVLAQQMNLKKDIVRVWFKNQRAKLSRLKSKPSRIPQKTEVFQPIKTVLASPHGVHQLPVVPAPYKPNTKSSAPAPSQSAQRATMAAPAPTYTCHTKTLRKRTVFTEGQLQELKRYFEQNQYPGYGELVALAQRLQLEEDRISVWFSNQRARTKDKFIRDPQGIQDPCSIAPALSPTTGGAKCQADAELCSIGIQTSDEPKVLMDKAPAPSSEAADPDPSLLTQQAPPDQRSPSHTVPAPQPPTLLQEGPRTQETLLSKPPPTQKTPQTSASPGRDYPTCRTSQVLNVLKSGSFLCLMWVTPLAETPEQMQTT
ncbi:homeobox protein ESX1-like [Erinaceus europaeus]|uniref:Homeobox protein ESX1-like n=1 Tax=Erinaceus europaeus TaxID=9365 RepID=A0ABM3VRK8_ERIEU|nr:homeobox protein ESX1-like [Erinaceus europaeus]